MPKGSAARQAPPLTVIRGQGQGRKARPKPVPRSRQLATMSNSDIICRVLMGNHSIDPDSYEIYAAPGGGWQTVFTCVSCGAEITKPRDRHGFREQNRYKHRKGYLMEEGGMLTGREKADLFMKLAGARSR